MHLFYSDPLSIGRVGRFAKPANDDVQGEKRRSFPAGEEQFRSDEHGGETGTEQCDRSTAGREEGVRQTVTGSAGEHGDAGRHSKCFAGQAESGGGHRVGLARH